MARKEATGGTSQGSDGDHACSSDSGVAVRREGGGESVSGVTEEGSSGNVAGKARWGGAKDWLSTMITDGEEAVDTGGNEEGKASAGDSKTSSQVWRLAARLAWLLLGFLAGAALATTVLFHKHDGYPVTCTVPT